jgi:hypothetical protein
MPNKTSRDIFKSSFSTGLASGVSNFQLQERERIDIEKQQRKDREKRRIENQKLEALHIALGVDTDDPAEFDPLTRQPKRNAGKINQPNIGLEVGDPEGLQREEAPTQQGFQRPSPLEEALLMEQMSPEGRSVYKDFIKREQPSISDLYFGAKEMKHPDREGGGLYGYNKETGELELISDNPNYQPKPITNGSYVIYGTAKIGDETVGLTGRRTRVVELDNGKFKLQDLGKIPSGSKGTRKEKDDLEFEIAMSDYQNSADGIANRREQYLSKDFSKVGGETSREDYRVGYNSAMNELALRTLNLGSKEARDEGMRIFNESQTMVANMNSGAIALSNVDRQNFYDAKKDEILSNMKPSGKWSFRDAQAIIKFLEFKYDRYLYQEGSRADDELLFENLELSDDGNVISKGSK